MDGWYFILTLAAMVAAWVFVTLFFEGCEAALGWFRVRKFLNLQFRGKSTLLAFYLLVTGGLTGLSVFGFIWSTNHWL